MIRMLTKSTILAVACGAVVCACSSEESPAEGSVTFIGMCDASAASALDEDRFVVADDEDNVLRVYSRKGGEPLFSYDLSEFLGNMGKKKPKEADLEAAAQIGKRTYWITSHGRNSKGKDQPQRERFFATELKVDGEKVSIETVGKPYSNLLDDLIADGRLKKYNLEAASKLAPKEPGGLNIEGMTGTPDGQIYIAFRNPLPEGKALVVPVQNPAELVDSGSKPRFGDPIELDLGGLGVRGIDFHQGRYVIIAGASGDSPGSSRLFLWDGKAQPEPVRTVALRGLNPEGISFHRGQEKGEYFLLSDDGTKPIDGTPCKSLKDPSLKRFRGRTVEL